MQRRWLHEWFAFGAFASWTSALLITNLVAPPTGRWAGADATLLAPVFSFLMSVAATVPLYLRTLLSRHRLYHRRFLVPLVLGLSHAPLAGGTMWLAEAVCRPSALDAMVLVAMFGGSALLGEVAYRACRTA
jgi:hypothetical protein